MKSFKDFLSRNSIVPSDGLPLIHTTQAYRIKSIWRDGKIIPQWCDVFETELTYLFVGRPAYRPPEGVGEAETWELPCCFIFSADLVETPERIFPFDSGAFVKKRMPRYISLMPLDEFEVSSVIDAPQRIVGAFFANPSDYFHGRPKGAERFTKDFSIGVFDEEVMALHRLSNEKHVAGLDDRRLSVEVQTTSEINFDLQPPLAVVAPMPYLADSAFRKQIKHWGAVPISYPISSLGSSEYYSAIYERVFSVLKRRKIL